MNPAVYIPIAVMLLILIFTLNHQKQTLIKKQIKKKRTEDRKKMTELAREFIGKECIIYTFNSQIEGVVKDVREGALLLEKAGVSEAVNLDFVVRVREYPRNKSGKKKSVVLD